MACASSSRRWPSRNGLPPERAGSGRLTRVAGVVRAAPAEDDRLIRQRLVAQGVRPRRRTRPLTRHCSTCLCGASATRPGPARSGSSSSSGEQPPWRTSGAPPARWKIARQLARSCGRRRPAVEKRRVDEGVAGRYAGSCGEIDSGAKTADERELRAIFHGRGGPRADGAQGVVLGAGAACRTGGAPRACCRSPARRWSSAASMAGCAAAGARPARQGACRMSGRLPPGQARTTPGERVSRRSRSFWGQAVREGSGRLELRAGHRVEGHPLTARVMSTALAAHSARPGDTAGRLRPALESAEHPPSCCVWLAAGVRRFGLGREAPAPADLQRAAYASRAAAVEGRPGSLLLGRFGAREADLRGALRDALLVAGGTSTGGSAGRRCRGGRSRVRRRTEYSHVDRLSGAESVRGRFDFPQPGRQQSRP